MINRVNVKNFRSLKEIELNLEKDTTLIIGENDAGKTSLIDVLKFFLIINKSMKMIFISKKTR